MTIATWIDGVVRDIRLAARRVARHRMFSAVVIACVALGTGAVIGVFSVLRPVLLQSVPFQDPDRLMTVASYNTGRTNPDERFWMSWDPTEQVILNQQSLEGVGGFYQMEFDVLGRDGNERVAGAQTLAGTFDVLHVRPVLGRTLRADDQRAGVRTALISEDLWTRRFARDPGVLGQTITLNERPYEIVGVLPAGYNFPNRAEIWASYHPDDYSESERRGMGVLLVIGRLAEGRTRLDLERDLEIALRATKELDPVFYTAWGLEIVTMREYMVGDLERPLWALFGGALLVFLLAVSNVVNLLLARMQGEHWDFALRTALGAGRARIAQQGFVEHGLLALAGAAVGTLLAGWGTSALLAATPLSGPAFDEVGISPLVVLVAFALAVVVALAMSALSAARGYDMLGTLRVGKSGLGRRERRVQRGFVIGQVALSVVLLVGAGLFARSFNNLQALELGFDSAPLYALRVSAPPSSLNESARAADFARAVIARVSAIPGVEAVGATSWVPFDDADVFFNHSVEDFPPQEGEQGPLAPGWIVAPGYFASMDIRILSGRDFSDADRDGALPVAIVNREFERTHWPDGSALGKRIKRGAYDMDRPWIEIVGVVEDIRSGTLSDPVRPHLYYPIAQSNGAFLSQLAYTIRYRGDPDQIAPAFRAAVAEVAPTATVYRATTGAGITRVALGRPRFNGLIIGAFAIIGLLLAAAGVYGCMAYAVGRRTREFGLRTALGARPAQVRSIVLREGAFVAGTGAVIGVAGALGLTRTVSELLFQVDPNDIVTYAVVTALLVGTVLLASYLPARRATKVDPTVALKQD